MCICMCMHLYMCIQSICIYVHVYILIYLRNYNDSSYVCYLKLTAFSDSCEGACILLLFLLEGCVCVLVWAVADRSWGTETDKAAGGLCRHNLYFKQENHHKKKKLGRAGQSWKQDCPGMSDMWYYLRLNPPGLGTVLLLGYCALQRSPWWGMGSELRPHSCGWEVRFPLKGGVFALPGIVGRVGSWVRK